MGTTVNDGTLTTEAADDWKREQARSWLRDVRSCVSKRRAVQNEMRAEYDAYDMMRGMTYGDKVDTSDMRDRILERIIHIDSMVDDLEALDAEYSEKVSEARRVLSRLTCHPCAFEVMGDHYLNGWTWERVAEEVGYSERQVMRICDDAMLECWALMPAMYRDMVPRADG